MKMDCKNAAMNIRRKMSKGGKVMNETFEQDKSLGDEDAGLDGYENLVPSYAKGGIKTFSKGGKVPNHGSEKNQGSGQENAGDAGFGSNKLIPSYAKGGIKTYSDGGKVMNEDFEEDEGSGQEDAGLYDFNNKAKSYSEGGEAGPGGASVHPLDQMFRKKFIDAKRAAYGALMPKADVMQDDDYDHHAEENLEASARMESDVPNKHQADEKDHDRLAWVRAFMTNRSMRSKR